MSGSIHGVPRAYMRAIIAEVGRRDMLQRLVAQAGFESTADHHTWVERSAVTAAVAAKLDQLPTPALGGEIRRLLLEAGWRERLHGGYWQWRARLVGPVEAGAAKTPPAKRRRPSR